MANWFTRVVDTVTPWDRGGEAQRRKEREEENQPQPQVQRQTSAPTQQRIQVVDRPNTQTVSVEGNEPSVSRPEDHFGSLNKKLNFSAPQNKISVEPTKNLEVYTPPKPGTVLEPHRPSAAMANRKVVVNNTKRKDNITLPDGRVIATQSAADTPQMIIDRGLNANKSWEQIAAENNYDVEQVAEYSRATRPNYGIRVEKPQSQGFVDRFRDVFDANTEADAWRRQEGNDANQGEDKPLFLQNPGNIVSETPIIGHITKALNTAGVQIPEVLYTIKGREDARNLEVATEAYNEAVKNGTQAEVSLAQEAMDAAYDILQNTLTSQDSVRTNYQDNSGGLFNAGTLYNEDQAKEGRIEDALKEIALPTAVAALDLYTLGRGSAVTQGIKSPTVEAGKKLGARQVLNQQKGNIAKLTAGNFGSGSLDAAANDASLAQSLQAGALNAGVGIVPDVGIPSAGRFFRNPFKRGANKVVAQGGAQGMSQIDNAAIDASVADLTQPIARNVPVKEVRDIPVTSTKDIPVSGGDIAPEPVRVRNTNEPKPLIQDVSGGESLATPNALVKQFGQDVRDKAGAEFNATNTPNKRSLDLSNGVKARDQEVFKLDKNTVIKSQDDAVSEYAAFLKDVGEKNGVDMIPDGEGGFVRRSNNVRFGETKGKKMTNQMWKDEAQRQLEAGTADPSIQKLFNEASDPEVQSILKNGEQAPVKDGRPIKVKQVNSIPVEDKTVNMTPKAKTEAPGKVRVSVQDSPSNTKSLKVASESTSGVKAKAPEAKVDTSDLPSVPKVGDTLSDGKIVTKRTVKAARANLRRAKALKKVQDETAETSSRIKSSGPASATDESFAPTGKFKKGKRGNVSETATRVTEAKKADKEMATKSVNDVIEQVSGKTRFSAADFRQIEKAIKTVKNMDPAYADLPEYKALQNSLKRGRSDVARQMGLINKISRRISSADGISSKWENKVNLGQDDPTRSASAAQLKKVQTANDEFVTLRDRAAVLEEEYKKTGSSEDLAAFKKAYDASIDADFAAKNVEVRMAKEVLKGSKADNAARVLNDLEAEAELNMMDYVTANQLSGPATGVRNLAGTLLASTENRVGANLRARVTKKIFGENVGGYTRKGAIAGHKEGGSKMVADIKNRTRYAGKNPIKQARNFGTTVNTLGESSMHAQKMSRLDAYYKRQLKEKGVKGARLKNDTEFLRITDPDNMGEVFMDSTMKSSGLTGIYKNTQKLEASFAKMISEKAGTGGVLSPQAADKVGKYTARLTLGYPTATGNFVMQSAKRLALGTPSFMEAGALALKGNKQGAALAFDRGLKEAGSGSAAIGAGLMLGEAGLVTGFYPKDKNERQRWKDEGKSELSINIGGTWHPIPQSFGMFGLPLLVGATIAEGGSDAVVDTFTTRENIFKLLPADQVKGVLEVVSGEGTENQDKAFVSGLLRSFIPTGSFLNQTAKGSRENIKDTTTKDFWSNVIDQTLVGIPGVDGLVDAPNKLSSTGEPLKSPNLAETYLGARSVEQESGIKNSKKVDAEINEILKGIDKYGALKDQNITAVLDGTGREAYDKAQRGEQLDESEIESLQKGLVKGVSSEGTDTVYLEKGQYASNLAALNLKRDLMSSDPTTKPSSLEDIDEAIGRGEVYKKDKTPYKDISLHKKTSLTEWRNMGNPDHSDYDPETYEKLWQLDQKLTEKGVSYNSDDPEESKYYSKTSKRGGSGGGSGSKAKFSAEFGKLKSGSFAPSVKSYETIDSKSGVIPKIAVKRPNIVRNVGGGRR